ncbi:WD repeat-containing protein 35 [Dinochytrium kinnereticum]|nr:WD repeat-containing protein 35 [Dinochytrium kinnereticum]
MKHLKLKWNTNGSILAVSGVQYARSSQGEEKEVSVVQFYDPFGQYLRSLKVPGKRISSLSWEHGGLRIALAVDSFIYFANIRPDYKWAFFAEDVLVYGHNRYDRPETSLVFWNTKTNERHTKLLNKLCFICSHGEHCLLVAKADDSGTHFTLTISNAIGTAIETKYIDFAPKFAVLTKQFAIVASGDIVLCWQFKALSKKYSILDSRKKDYRERSFHIDDVTENGIHEGGSTTDLRKKRQAHDPISAITASESVFAIARQSGLVLLLSMPGLTLESRHLTPVRPHSIALNCNNTRMAILDTSGVLKLLDITYRPATTANVPKTGEFSETGKFLEFERKDVWDVKCFDNLQIKAALLDEIFKEPESPSKESLLLIDSKTLRDTRNILSQVGLTDGLQFVEDNPHPRLWRLIADAALEALNFSVAQKAYIRCADYAGLQFIKRLLKLEDPQKQKAEISAHFSQYDVSERLYLEIDRKDLAMELRIRLGDWFRVVQLIKSGGSGDDILLEKAWNCIGDYYYDRQRWSQAITYYAQGRNTERLVECYYIGEDYDSLEKVMFSIPESSPLLPNIAKKFVSVGLCDQAVTAYLKTGDIKSAIDTCVYLNKWNTAVELAEANKYQGIENLLATYAAHLLEKKKLMSAVELYRKANYCQKSARILFNLAEEASKAGKNPLKVKKLYVLAALEVERYHQLNKVQRVGGRQEISPLDGLLAEDRKNNDDTRFLDNVWRGAEAYHYYLLAQRQFYAGNASAAMKTACHLVNYDDVFDPKVTNSLLALISFNNSHFHTCSTAFIKLESLPKNTEAEKEAFENLALNIFTKYPPNDPKAIEITCTNCASIIDDGDSSCATCHFTFPICIASGRPIYESIHFMCHVCKHRAIESEIGGFTCCPLHIMEQVRTAKTPWVEKYRPHTMENIASQEETVSVLKKTLQSGNLPHLLFYGPPGTGKTSTILALSRELYGPELMRSRILELNASDERGIDIVREKVKNFARTTVSASSSGNKSCPPFKIIILDEADSMTTDAQAALRRTMETYSRVTRFCLICNYVSKIIDPLASRCAKFRFQPVGDETMRNRLQEICEKEQVEITPEAISAVCTASEGDMRRAIMMLQSAQSLNLQHEISPATINEIAGIVPQDLISNLLEAFRIKSYKDSADLSNVVMKSGYSVVQVLQQVKQSHFPLRKSIYPTPSHPFP